jgi:hypothetical protein
MKWLLLVFGFIGVVASLSSNRQPVDAVKDRDDARVEARILWFRRPKQREPTQTSSIKVKPVTGFVEKAVVFSCATPESELTNAPKVVHTMDDGSKNTVYFGYRQASSINKNPNIALFKNGQQVWCREDYETSGADGVSMGGLWNMEITTTTETTSSGSAGWWAKLFGSSKSSSTITTKTVSQPSLYAVFTVDGTQDTPDVDFRRFTGQAWLKSYGKGGGPKVAVILQLDAATGNAQRGTFVRAELDNGNANSLVINNLSLDSCTSSSSSSSSNTSLVVHATSYYLPLRADTTRFALADCAPDTDSPFDYTLTLSSDLTQAKSAACRLEIPKC